MTAVSAIVVTYKTGPRLKECLYALQAEAGVSEIIIVDNGNPQSMLDWLTVFAARSQTVHLKSGHGNIGFGAGVNLGARAATGPHILVINPDAVLRWNSIGPLQETAGRLKSPWLIGGRIYDVRGREERGPRRRELTLLRALSSFLGWNSWTLEGHPAPAAPVEMPVISGAFFLTNLDSLNQLGGFDEAYFLHVEDVDLCRRCREAGGIVMYDPRAGALHYGSTSETPSKEVARHKADSLARYFRTYARTPLDRLLTAMLVPLIRFAVMRRAR